MGKGFRLGKRPQRRPARVLCNRAFTTPAVKRQTDPIPAVFRRRYGVELVGGEGCARGWAAPISKRHRVCFAWPGTTEAGRDGMRRELWGAMVRRARPGLAAVWRVGVVAAGGLLLAHCSASDKVISLTGKNSRYSDKVVADGQPVPKGGGVYKLGQPYTINGRTYHPNDNPSYRGEGVASWYGPDFHGRLTANGEVFDMHSISAAHPTMPMPS